MSLKSVTGMVAPGPPGGPAISGIPTPLLAATSTGLPEKKFLISDKIDIEDLNIDEINSILNRKQVKLKKIKKLSKKTILVTGAAGTIGSEICRQLLQHSVKNIK